MKAPRGSLEPSKLQELADKMLPQARAQLVSGLAGRTVKYQRY